MSCYPLINMPDCIIYVPDFISDLEEQEILLEVDKSPKPKWTVLSNRRLQNWGGVPHHKGMIAEDIPKWLRKFMALTKDYFPADKPANHVLVNEYLPGQGILPHTDGPLFHPVICTISCGSHTVLNFQQKQETEISHSLLLERRSLVVVTDDLYHNYLHSISEIEKDIVTENLANLDQISYSVGDELTRSRRISLTIRHVPSTSKFKLKLSK